MLHEELPSIVSRPLDGERWLLPTLGGAAVLSALAVWWLFGPIAAAVLAALAVGGAIAGGFATRKPAAPDPDTLGGGPDYALVGAALALTEEPAAITSTNSS